jgi:hypothetical protein
LCPNYVQEFGLCTRTTFPAPKEQKIQDSICPQEICKQFVFLYIGEALVLYLRFTILSYNKYVFLLVVSCYKTFSYILCFLIINKRPQLRYKLGKFTSRFVCYYTENAYMVAPNATASRLRKAKLSLYGSV